MAGGRIGLKQIAELAGVSVGNVSLVLNGHGDDARISKATQDRILEASKQLHYQPNVYARRLRMQTADRLIIGVFFAPTRHVATVGSFFSGIHDILESETDSSQRSEIVLYPYTQDKLAEMDGLLKTTNFNGLIFMGMSMNDFDYLENLDISIPTVLFNRVSKKHHYVYTDNTNIGRLAARLFYQRGYHKVCLVAGIEASAAGWERRKGFIEECKFHDMPLPDEQIIKVDVRNNNGREAAEKIPTGENRPDAVFLAEGNMGLSTLHGLIQKGIRVPDDTSLLCYSSGIYDEYTIPSLSSIVIPMEDMSRDCLLLLKDAIRNPGCGQMHITHNPILTIRESMK